MAVKRLLTSCFGLGHLPLAPGTWGSLPPVIVFAMLNYWAMSAAVISIVMAILVLAGCIVCVKLAPAVITVTGRLDPKEIVADEFAGQALTFLAIGAVKTGKFWIIAMLGFVFFRLFDITKPWPIRRLEKLPAGWGILCDDLLAAVYAAVAILVCFKLWIAG